MKASYNVVSSMKSVWLILVLLFARPLDAADLAPMPPVAAKFLALFQDLRDAETQKAAGKIRHVSFRISSGEIDDYMRWSLKATPRPGLESITVKFFPRNYVSTFTIVDFDAVEKWKPGTIPGILRPVLNGKKTIWVDYSFNDDNGKMTVSVEKDTGASDNTASGAFALQYNTTGSNNTAAGAGALTFNTAGSDNTAAGAGALENNTTGSSNTANGAFALPNNTSGNNNIAIGANAASNVSSGNNNIHVGSQGSAADSGAIRIGTPGTQASFFAAGIRGVTTANNDAIPVVIDSAGQLGTVSSSRRFKEDIRAMGDASRGLMRLRPVTFRYRNPFADGSKPIQYGLIAEEVAEVYPDLVAHSADGQIETVKYQVLDAMLLNEGNGSNK